MFRKQPPRTEYEFTDGQPIPPDSAIAAYMHESVDVLISTLPASHQKLAIRAFDRPVIVPPIYLIGDILCRTPEKLRGISYIGPRMLDHIIASLEVMGMSKETLGSIRVKIPKAEPET